MDNQRFFLYASLALVLFLLWQNWQRDQFVPEQLTTDSAQVAQAQQDTPDQSSTMQDVPEAAVSSGLNATKKVVKAVTPAVASKRVLVQTDVLKLEIDTRGADIRDLLLIDYPISVDQQDKPLRLLQDQARIYVSQSGLLHDRIEGVADVKQRAPSHHAIYETAQSRYELADGENELVVPFTWRSNSGIEVTKTYRFERGSYLADVDFKVANQSGETWVGRQYRQLRHGEITEYSGFFAIPTFTGAAYYDEKYTKLSFGDFEDEPIRNNITGGWAALLQHYFVSAWIPGDEERNYYYSNVVDSELGQEYIIGLRSEPLVVESGGSERFHTRFFAGPKVQNMLEEIQPSLELTTDYGMFTPLSKPLFWLMDKFHSFTNNWGVAIILVTLLIKIVFYKLSEASYRSMAKMRKVQPRFQAIRERYADDKQKLNQAVMELYKKEKINPAGGCLPILVQMPVFLALYWVLVESVELRQAPFMLWVQDLSIKDPLFVLPVLMGITMFIQFKLNPTPPDPMQEKIFMIMPLFMTVFMAFFPAGLVLYWFVNNLLSIAQQWVITKRVESE